MKIMYLEDITNFSNKDKSCYFMPINAVFNYYDDFKNEVNDLLKIIFLVKHLELCNKYGLAVDTFSLENYLSKEEGISTEDIYEFIENSGICENDKMTVQNFFAEEFMEYFEQIDLKLMTIHPANLREKVYLETKEIVKEKYDYDLKLESLEEPVEQYNEFLNHLLSTSVFIPFKEPEAVLKKIEEETKEKSKVYIKNKSNPFGC